MNKDEILEQIKATKALVSWDNNESFWFIRPSLVNVLKKAGFSSV